MNILLCPDKFKGSLSAEEVCSALTKGLMSTNTNINITSHPMADGGDGSIDILKALLKLKIREVHSLDPLRRKIETEYYYSEDAAYIELASASGLILLNKRERNPMTTSTFGTGLMIKDAIDQGFQTIYLFIGGSATNDGGIGIAKAFGFDFIDNMGKSLEPIGSNLGQIRKIENNSVYNFENINITVLCDVTNPMYGLDGAAFVYASQKGATPEDIATLDNGLKNYSDILKTQFSNDLSHHLGMGAAGAVGASLVGLLNAKLENGFEMLANITQLEDAIKNSDLVITGEGKIDHTSFQGKVVGNILTYCKHHDIPCGIVAGIIEEFDDKERDFKFQKSIISIAKDLDEAMTSSKHLLYEIGKDLGKFELNTIF